MKNARHEQRWWNQDPPPLPPGQVLTPSIPTTKGRYVRANQIRIWAQSIPSDGGALSWKLKLWYKIITEIKVMRHRLMRRVSYLCHLHHFPLLPPSDEEEERHCNSPEQEKLGAKSSWEEGPPASRIFPIYRYKSWTALNSKFNSIWRVGLTLEFFGMSDQPDMICSCHMISSTMKSRFLSLIC